MRPNRLPIILLSLQLLIAAAANAQPTLQWTELEQRLLNSKALSLDYNVTASGAIQVSIEGSLRKTATGDIALQARGVFAGQDVDLIAIKNGQVFEYGSRNTPTTAEPPAALWEALILGFTRMGILHNIENLTAAAAPDHAEGGVADWVLVNNVERDKDSFSFDIIVNDTPSGSATLSINGLGYPESRQQTVAFPGGEMKVLETYTSISRSE